MAKLPWNPFKKSKSDSGLGHSSSSSSSARASTRGPPAPKAADTPSVIVEPPKEPPKEPSKDPSKEPPKETPTLPNPSSEAQDNSGTLRGETTGSLTLHSRRKSTVSSYIPYALPWTEHPLELKPVKSLMGSKPNEQTESPFPLQLHTCSPLQTSKQEFVIFGGRARAAEKAGDEINDTFLLSTADMSLVRLETSGAAPQERCAHQAAVVGRVLVVFGGTTVDSNLYFLDLDTRAWSSFRPPAPFPGSREGHTLTAVGNTLWVYGGRDGKKILGDLWCIELGSLKAMERVRWRQIPKCDVWPPARAYHSTVHYDDGLYIFGGHDDSLVPSFNDLWEFNTRTETWSQVQCSGLLPEERDAHCATVVGDNMFIFAGFRKPDEWDRAKELSGTFINDAFVFNFADNTWTSLAMMGPTPLPGRHRTMVAAGTRLMVLGGKGPNLLTTKPHIHMAETNPSGSLSDGLAKLQFSTETTNLKFTTEAVDLSRFVRKQGDAAHSLAGFSDVWKGELTETGQPIAIKVLRVANTNNLDNPQSGLLRKRFDRELFIWMECQHPRVLELLGYAYIEGIPCLISPWCPNGNVTEYLIRKPNADRLRLIIQAAEGLAYLHGRDPVVVHSDIKPANVLVNDQEDVKLCDFGVSKLLQDAPSGFTTTASIKGTLRYSAKELLQEDAESTTMSDVYAFGSLILQVMTGKLPYITFNSDMGVIKAIWGGATPSPEDYPELPASDPLWSVMRECWDEDPSQRPTMERLVTKLRRFTER